MEAQLPEDKQAAFRPVPLGGDVAAQEAREGSPLPAVPPEWVSVLAALMWIARRYGVSGGAIAADLILSVRSGPLRDSHRIAGIKPRLNRYGTEFLPSGLDHKRRMFGGIIADDWIVATDWEAADANWQDCTAGGWAPDGGSRERLTIEVPWAAVEERFAAHRVREWKRENEARTGSADPAGPVKEVVFARGNMPIAALDDVAGPSNNAKATTLTATPYRSGAPGRPTSIQVVKAEFQRRKKCGQVASTLGAEAKTLVDWLIQKHPEAPRLTSKTIMNRLREDYRRHITTQPGIMPDNIPE